MKFISGGTIGLGTLLLLAACKQKTSTTLEVKGTLKHTEQLASQYPGAANKGVVRLSLNEISFGSDVPPISIDTVTLQPGQTNFDLKGKSNGTGMYSLEIDDGPLLPLINDKPVITVDLDFSHKDNFYTVSGSPASESLQHFINEYAARSRSINADMARLDSLKRLNASDSLQLLATSQKNQAISDLNQFLKDFLARVEQPILGSFALGRAAQTLSQSEFETALNSISTRFPDDPSIVAIKTQYETFKNQAAEQEKERASRSLVGKQAPDLVLPDANGKEIALSSFRGKYLLVDFWASWCRPCREENPNVVAAYNRFKNKNFTILGVSLDRKKDDWLQAIQNDHLNWTQVSDLAFWNSKAVTTFNFDGIPFNVLIDPQGKVIAESLRGDQLQKKLAEVLQ